jgi:hypothetical protein
LFWGRAGKPLGGLAVVAARSPYAGEEQGQDNGCACKQFFHVSHFDLIFQEIDGFEQTTP